MLGVKGSVRGYHAQVVALSGNVLELPLISGAAGNPSEGCATEGPRAGRETQSSHPAASACTHDCDVAVTQADLQGLDSVGFRHLQQGGVEAGGGWLRVGRREEDEKNNRYANPIWANV